MNNVVRLPVRRHARTSSCNAERFRAANSAKTCRLTSDRSHSPASATIAAQCADGMPRFRQPLTVGSANDNSVATAPVPPRAVMIESHVMSKDSIVRAMRTGQEFASRETTISPSHDPIKGMIDDPKIVGQRLKNLREALGFSTQVAFARELGIEKNTYNPFEKGARELTFETACLIRKKFKIPIDWLFWGEDDELPYHVKVKLEARRQAA